MARPVLAGIGTMPERPRCLIVVRRGETDVFERLQAEFAGKPDVADVIWDRRVRDRRVVIRDVDVERRRGERRAPLDATLWASRGYFMARPQPSTREAARVRGRRPRGKSRPAR